MIGIKRVPRKVLFLFHPKLKIKDWSDTE